MEPVFCIDKLVSFAAPPGTRVTPPYLLIVEQVAVLVELESKLLQDALPEVSFIVNVPVLAVLVLF